MRVSYGSGSVAEAMEQLHDASLSDDPTMACGARLAKRIAGVLEDWINDERQRGTDPVCMIKVTPACAVMVPLTTILNLAEPGRQQKVAWLLREFWLSAYDNAIPRLDDGRRD